MLVFVAVLQIFSAHSIKVGLFKILYGNLAKDGCVTKISGIEPDCYKFSGVAKTFDSEEEAQEYIDENFCEIDYHVETWLDY